MKKYMIRVGRCQSQATSHKNSLPATMPGGRRVAQSGYLCQQMFSSVVFMKFVYIVVQSVKLEPSCGPFYLWSQLLPCGILHLAVPPSL